MIRPPAGPEPPPEVVLDHVGGLNNAATVIAALHRGEKRLVFCDSRARVERLAADLRVRGVATFVSHSSLGIGERRQAERAFADGRDCVIVATSALVLGIDVGDLDRVIQIDAPPTVSSFLQRMGRTGRRPGMIGNALFLATSDERLLCAAAMIELWRSGFVEPAIPPPMPLHILAQQVLALALQEGGLGRTEWPGWVGAVPAFRELEGAVTDPIIAGMLERGILWDEAGVLWLGREGQDGYGRRNFLNLVSVFTAPLFAVQHGRRELGSVDQSTFLARRDDGPPVLLLAGRAWQVTHLDWRRRRAFVEPAEDPGRSRWRGQGQSLSYELCRSIRRLLAGEAVAPAWSRRAAAQIGAIRSELPWLAGDDRSVLNPAGGEAVWWTFAGGRANAALAHELGRRLDVKVSSDNFLVKLPSHPSRATIEQEIRRVAAVDPRSIRPAISESGRDELKFSECLPIELANRVIRERLGDPAAIAATLARPARVVIGEPA